HRRAPAHDVHVLARWRGSMADRGDTDRLAVVSMNDVAGRRTHRPWRSRATDARSPVSGAVGNGGRTGAWAASRPRGLAHISGAVGHADQTVAGAPSRPRVLVHIPSGPRRESSVVTNS